MTKKIIINSQGPFNPNGSGITTGFSKAIYPICNELARTNTVTHVCHDYQGLDFSFNGYKVARGNRDFNKTAYEMKLHVEGEKPDAVLALNEPWGVAPYQDIKFGDTKFLYYIPIDGYPCDRNVQAMKTLPDLFIPITNFGKKVMANSGIYTADPIPHSYDPSNYYRMGTVERNAMLEEYDLSDKFVVGFVGRLQDRKNIMALMVAFAKFVEDKDDVFLFLNMDLDPTYSNFDPIKLARNLDIDDKIMLQNKKVPEKQMGEIYNCFDVYINTACSEGFDIPVMEAQACGVPCIVSDYSGHAELVNGHGHLINIDSYEPMENGINWAYINIKDAVKKLNELYESKHLRRTISDANVKWATNYTDRAVMPKWTALFDNLADELEKVQAQQPIRTMSI
ncbi:MAG: glycosyltransferase [Methanosarcina sp.]|nr:glycosyltransferase [Methanosarcina sp.]